MALSVPAGAFANALGWQPPCYSQCDGQRRALRVDTGLADGGRDTTPIVTSPTLSLTVNAYKVRRLQKANVWWSGFNSAEVNIYRNGALIVTTENDGFYTDAINAKRFRFLHLPGVRR